jgi:dTDP-L-rhamnose 4-epimerase
MSFPFRRVLVTGGAGFIGSHVCDALLGRGAEVRVFDSLDPQVHGPDATWPDYLSTEVEPFRGDIRDRDALREAMAGCDAVVHLAAAVGVGQSQYQPDRYVRVNTLGTATLLDLIVNGEARPDRLFIASSMSIYGEGLYRNPKSGHFLAPALRPEDQLARGVFECLDPATGDVLDPVATPEEKPLHTSTVYALTKKDQEEYGLVLGAAHRLSVVAGRFFNVIGTRQSLNNPYTGAAAIFTSRLLNDNPPIVYEDGGQSRDFIDVRDVADGVCFLLSEPRAELQPFNICTGNGTSILELIRLIAVGLGKQEVEPEVTRRFRAGDIRHCFGDPSRLASLGWTAQISLSDALAHLNEWSSQQDSVDRVAHAHEEMVRRGLVR